MTRVNLVPTDVAEHKATNYATYLSIQHERVLELGPYDGTDTIYLVKKCKYLVAVEGREENIVEVEKRLKQNNITNVLLLLANLEEFDLRKLGKFDCVWASGIIYHMSKPLNLISQITDITNECFGWTHLANVGESTGERDGYAGKEWAEQVDNPSGLAGLSPASWWLTPDAFIKVWADLGWTCVYTTPPTPHVNGSLAAQFWATNRIVT